jgi:hypothetical protein
VTDETGDTMFAKFDYNFTGKIDYFEFRDIFLETSDLRLQLEQRNVEVPAMIRKKTMISLLRGMLLEEERRERAALAEARRYKKWILAVRDSKKVRGRKKE